MDSFFKTEQSVWEFFKNSSKPVVLYGMGDGADKVLSAFSRFGIEVSGVMASDDFVRGQQFHGFTVKKQSDLERELGDFCVALCFASQLPDVISHIKEVAAAHELRVPSVPAFGSVIFDREFSEKYSGDIKSARSLLSDELSVRVFDGVLRFYHSGELHLLDGITTDKDEAFYDILRLSDSESYLDLGAYDGDTIREFLHYSGGGYKRITALEPNAKNFSKLLRACSGMRDTQLLQLGAFDRDAVLFFNNKAGRNSAVAESGVETRVRAVDELLGGESVSYVKADVEGADFEALTGMAKTIAAFRPKLNCSVYHRFEDIFRLPLLLKDLCPDYKLYLRHHPYIPAWDTNVYCVTESSKP